MPKISREGGPSHAGVDSPAEGLTAEETSQDPQYPFVLHPEGVEEGHEEGVSTEDGSPRPPEEGATGSAARNTTDAGGASAASHPKPSTGASGGNG